MPTRFTDANGKTWNIHLDVDAIDAVNIILNENLPAGEEPFDLLEVTDPSGAIRMEMFNRFFSSMRRAGRILNAAVRWETGSEEEQKALANGLRGDALRAAFAAFMEELASFFPEGQRHILNEIFQSYETIGAKQGEIAAQALRTLTAEAASSPEIAPPAPAAS